MEKFELHDKDLAKTKCVVISTSFIFISRLPLCLKPFTYPPIAVFRLTKFIRFLPLLSQISTVAAWWLQLSLLTRGLEFDCHRVTQKLDCHRVPQLLCNIQGFFLWVSCQGINIFLTGS